MKPSRAMSGSRYGNLRGAFDVGDAFRPSTLMSRLARKWAAPHLSFAEIRRVDAMIAGPHAQSLMYNLVATSRERYFSAGFKEDLGTVLPMRTSISTWRAWPGGIPLNRSLYLGYKIQLAGLLLGPKGDRVAMANGVEARYPFLDEDVIALTSRLHPRWKLRRGLRDKYLLRQAAQRVLPEAVAQRPKHMFRAPLAESFLARPPAFVLELISAESLARTGYFDVERVTAGLRMRWQAKAAAWARSRAWA